MSPISTAWSPARAFALPEYSDSGAETLGFGRNPLVATTYCASTRVGCKRVIRRQVKFCEWIALETICEAANPVAPIAVAQDEGPKGQELREYCYGLIESGEFGPLNLGECMSFNETMDRAGFAAHICDAFLELGLLEDFGFDSYSDCILNI